MGVRGKFDLKKKKKCKIVMIKFVKIMRLVSNGVFHLKLRCLNNSLGTKNEMS